VANLADLLINLRADPSGIEEGMSKGKKLALAGGAAMAGAIAAGALEAMDIGAANDKLAAQLGLTETESARVGKVAGTLFANAYGGSMDEVNAGVGAVMSSIKGMRKASDTDIQAMTTKALDFATAFEVDVAEAAKVAGIAVNAGIAKDATQAFDLLTAASQRVPAAVRGDVLASVDEYGQFFNTIGIGGEQMFGMLVDAADKGMFGIDKVGDAIKEFTILSTNLDDTGETYKALGLDAEKMSAAILRGGDYAGEATQQIVEALLGVKDPSKQAMLALEMFGTPLEDLNVKDIPEFLKTLQGGTDAMAGFEGAADRMGASLNDNASTNLTAFKRQAQMAFVNLVGGQVIPLVEKAATWLAYTLGPAITGVAAALDASIIPALKATAKFISDNRQPITIVAGVITAMLIPAFAVLAAQAVTSAASVVAAWVSQSVAAARSAVSTVAALTRVAVAWIRTAVQAMASAARMAAAWLIALGPIALVIAAVVGVVAVIIKNWDRIVAATRQLWEWVKNATSAAWAWIKNAIGAAVDAVKGAITGGLSAAGKAISSYLNMWKGFFTGAWSAIKTVVGGGIGWIVDKIAGMPGAIARVAAGLFDGIKDAFRSAINWIIGAWNGLQFSIPGFDPPGPGPKFGGFTLGLPDIPMLAAGGPASGGMPHIVGERGPELFVPRTSGYVHPNDALGGDVYVVVEMDGQQFDARIKKVQRDKNRATKNAAKVGARRAPARG
jgi:phage-related minor tail protein